MRPGKRIYRKEDGVQIPGVSLPAFLHNGGIYTLFDIIVFKDGVIDCLELLSFEEFRERVESGWIVTTLPEGARIDISLLAQCQVTGVHSFVREEEFVKEVADEIERLNDRPTTIDRCRVAYTQYNADPSEETRLALKEAYEAIPEHNRDRVLGDMDVKDIPIRMIIYGEEEVEKWSHRIVLRELGLDPLPTIQVQKPDESQ